MTGQSSAKKGDTELKGSFVDTVASLTFPSSFLKLEQAKIRLKFKTRLT